MKLTVLMDNNTYIDRYFLGEPGLSYWVEDEGVRLLFDTAYSDAFLKNAQQMQIALSSMTHLVFSHGHNDHTWGLKYLLKQVPVGRIQLVTHPDCFLPKRHDGLDVGSAFDEETLDKMFRLELTTEPYWFTKNLVYLGEIPRVCEWEQGLKVGEVCTGDEDWEPDGMLDDSALAYKTDEGIFIITGCSHSGICNIVTRAMEVCGDKRLLGIIGGMHMLQNDDRSRRTVEFLKQHRPQRLYPAHCTCLDVKADMIAATLPVVEVGVGLEIEFK